MRRFRSLIYGFAAAFVLITIGLLMLQRIHSKDDEIAKNAQEMLHSSYYHCQSPTDPRTCVFDPDAYLEAKQP